jgi:hypothetical protein
MTTSMSAAVQSRRSRSVVIENDESAAGRGEVARELPLPGLVLQPRGATLTLGGAIIQRPEEPARPAMCGVLRHAPAQSRHPALLLFGLHAEGPRERLRGAIEIPGIDDQRLPQLRGGARELAQHENAGVVLAGGDVLLRD